MKTAVDDLAQRRPVWEALSDMFLDTDVSLAREWRVKVLAASPYSLDELEQILLGEVAPVCLPNLLCVAGEWAGFDQRWLESHILRRLRSPWRCRLSALFGPGKFLMPYSSEWRYTREGVERWRNEVPR